MASVDLLPQLRVAAAAAGHDGGSGLDTGHVEVELQETVRQGDERTMDDFHAAVQRVNEQLQNMRKYTPELNQVHNQLHCATSDASKKKLRDDASALQDKFSTASRAIKTDLDEMESLMKEFQETAKSHPAELRIQQNQFMLKRDEFVSALTAFHEVEQSNKAKYRDTIARRIKTKFSHQQLGDEQVEKMADEVIANGTESAIFSSNKMSIAATTLEEVVEMRRDIQKIEVGLKLLNQMMLDMAVLVHEQGELINDIRGNVQKATEYTKKGAQVMVTNNKKAAEQRRRMCWLIVCVVVLFAVGLIVVVAVLG
eukprot:TRINITY_DN1490_c0_g3_i1.p2 TRINITY_DN1490_c0_g3~~TRINITY_DN1490_c0_g3_i1.p2  ORF type:complete len:312 (+),score=135.87 TRINITY_DN1490_c0_g3_i1:56-991(+)